jgi:hypothetical protein
MEVSQGVIHACGILYLVDSSLTLQKTIGSRAGVELR